MTTTAQAFDTPDFQMDFSRCGCCDRRLIDEDIVIAGRDLDGLPKSVSHWCSHRLKALSALCIPPQLDPIIAHTAISVLHLRGHCLPGLEESRRDAAGIPDGRWETRSGPFPYFVAGIATRRLSNTR